MAEEQNYRLTLTIELDTESRVQAERWESEVIAALDDVVPRTGLLSDLELVDEFGDVATTD